MATISQYFRYRQWINTSQGGYLEDYNLNTVVNSPTQAMDAGTLNAVKAIVCLRGQLLEGNSKIANGEISIETIPGQNPAEGFNIPHNVANSSPVLLNDPSSGYAETQIGIAIDSEQAIAYRLNTQIGFSELRTLRSLRATWVNQWGVLYPNINTQLGIWGAMLPARQGVITGYPAGINNPAGMIAYFMLVVLVNTQLIQPLASGGYTYNFEATPYATPSSVLSPSVINPIMVPQLTRRKIGEGWPKTRGKMQSFGTHG